MSFTTCSHEDVNGGSANVNGRRLHQLITSHNKRGCYIWLLKRVWGRRDYQLMNDVGGGGAALEKKKRELWQHNKNTNIVTNSNALLFPPLLLVRWQALPVSPPLSTIGRPLHAPMTRSSGAVGRPLIAWQCRGALASSDVPCSREDVDCSGTNDGALAPSVAAPCSRDDEEAP